MPRPWRTGIMRALVVPAIDKVRQTAAKQAVPPARGCQYSLWPDGAAPTHEYCGKPVKEGSAYCPEHHARTHLSLAKAEGIEKRRAKKLANAKLPQ